MDPDRTLVRGFLPPFGVPVHANVRLPALDELKGAAILMIVVLYHAGGVLGFGQTLHGETGVDIFVVLSGMGLALGTQGEPAGKYLARRFVRIYPAYWIVYTAYLVAAITLKGSHFSADDVIVHCIGMQAWFGDVHAMSVNDSFWFVSLIVALYAVYLPLRRCIDRPDILLFAGIAWSVLAGSIFLTLYQPACFGHLACRIPGFFVGLVIGHFMRTGSFDCRRAPAVAAAMLLLLYLPWAMSYLFTSPWVSCSVMATYVFGVRRVTPSAGRSVLRYLGSRSLEIFLIHQPLIRDYNLYVLNRLFPGQSPGAVALVIGMLVGFALTLVLSELLHRALAPLYAAVARWSRSPKPGPVREFKALA